MEDFAIICSPSKDGQSHELFECSVVVDENLSIWFSLESGVQQGCVICPILFLVAIDWIMRRTTADRPRGQSSAFSLEDSKTSTLQITSMLSQQHVATYRRRPTGTLRLTINTSEIQVLCISAIPDAPITAESEPLDLVEEFTNLGNLAAKGNAAQKDIKARLGKPRVTVARLQPVWRRSNTTLGRS